MIADEATVAKSVENLKKRKFDVYVCKTGEEARNLALSLIPADDVVAWGGSKTAEQIGLIDAVKAKFATVDRDSAKTVAEKREAMRKSRSADTVIAGINAISSDGWLVNIDGTGNRVAAICFGPENVILVAGTNKITGAMQSAIARARNVAAPINAKRFDLPNPCTVSGKCADCISDTTICSQFLETRYCKPAGRIKVILIEEELGF